MHQNRGGRKRTLNCQRNRDIRLATKLLVCLLLNFFPVCITPACLSLGESYKIGIADDGAFVAPVCS